VCSDLLTAVPDVHLKHRARITVLLGYWKFCTSVLVGLVNHARYILEARSAQSLPKSSGRHWGEVYPVLVTLQYGGHQDSDGPEDLLVREDSLHYTWPMQGRVVWSPNVSFGWRVTLCPMAGKAPCGFVQYFWLDSQSIAPLPAGGGGVRSCCGLVDDEGWCDSSGCFALRGNCSLQASDEYSCMEGGTPVRFFND